jgi:hypothetical protein
MSRSASDDDGDHGGDDGGNEKEIREREQPQEGTHAMTTSSAAGEGDPSMLTSFIEISGLDPLTASHYLQV